MKIKTTFKNTVGSLRRLYANRWILFCLVIPSSTTHRPLIVSNCSLFDDNLLCVSSEWISRGKCQTYVFRWKCIPTEGTCSGLWCSGWSILEFFYVSSSYFEPSSESFVSIDLFPQTGYRWLKMLHLCSAILYTWYILLITFYINRPHARRKEVVEPSWIYTFMRLWLQKLR